MTTPEQTLDFIRNTYQKIYKNKEIEEEAVLQITQDITQVSEDQNADLTKAITAEEINRVINILPNNKAPGSDRLTYEFYKDTQEVITPVLVKLFNHVLESGQIPSS